MKSQKIFSTIIASIVAFSLMLSSVYATQVVSNNMMMMQNGTVIVLATFIQAMFSDRIQPTIRALIQATQAPIQTTQAPIQATIMTTMPTIITRTIHQTAINICPLTTRACNMDRLAN